MTGWEVNFKEDKQVWDSFVSASPQRSIFVYSKFLDSLSVTYDLVTCYDKDNVVAGAVIIYADSGDPISTTHPFTQYQGILLADNAGLLTHSQITREFRIVEHFIGRLVERYKRCCLCQSWRYRDMRPFQWYNYHSPMDGKFNVVLRYTGILDLQAYSDFDDYLASVRTLRRRQLKKSSNLLKLRMVEDEVLLDELHAKTFERQGIERTPSDSLLVRSISRQSFDGKYGKMACATLNDVPVSAILFLYDDRTAYYLFGANDPAYRNTFAGTFLMMQMIKDAFERGIREVDFVGVNSPNRGDFKISFNADIKPYFISSLPV